MMIRKLIRNTAFLLVLCLLGGMVLTGLPASAAGAAGGRSGTYHPDEWLPEAALGETLQSGDWLYAVRGGDGYAALIGYTGDSREEMILPSSLGGRDLASIEPGALANCGASKVHIPGSVLRISETAFGDLRPALFTLSGSAGEAFAASNGLECRSERSYRLADGVVDLTDAKTDRIRRRGDSWVWINRLEGLRLTAGSIFFYKDARDIENGYRVLSMEEENGGFLLHVEMPEASEIVVDYTFSNTISLTADDFIPAEGAVFSDGGPGSKDGHAYTKRSKTHYEFFEWKPKITTTTDGDGEAESSGKKKDIGEFEVAVSGDLEQTVTYNYRYENGRLVQASMVDDSTNTVNLDFKITGQSKGNPFGKPKENEMNLGHFKVGCAFFQFSGSVNLFFKVTSGITIACTTVSHTNKEYNFATESWVVLESTRNTYANPNDVSLDPEPVENTSESYTTVSAKIEVKAGIKCEFEFIIFDLVTAASVEVEGGLKLSLSGKDNCVEVGIGPYVKFSVFVGLWHKSSVFNFTIGVKKAIVEEESDLGKGESCHVYVLADLPDIASASRINDANKCPFHDGQTATVTFDTKTSQQIEPLELLRGDPVPWDPSYQLADDPALGRFLGWNLKDNQKASDGRGFLNQDGVEEENVYRADHNLILHAVWENLNEVIFYEAPDNRKEIAPRQYVPYNGKIIDPKVGSENGNWIVYWYTLNDGTGNSVTVEFQDSLLTMNDTYELYACRTGSIAPPDGNDPTKFTLIGNPRIFDQYQGVVGSYSIDDYDIEIRTDPVIGSKVAHITNVKGNPEYLKLPYEVFIRCVVDNANDLMALPIIYTKISLTRDDNYTPEEQALLDQYLYNHTEEELQEIFIPVEIDPGAFDNCTRLKVVQLVGRHRLVLGSMLSNIPTLKLVDMRGCLLEEQKISDYAFSGCTGLEAIAVNGYVSHIGQWAFENCSSMDQNLIPDSVLTIGSGAYYGCGMRSITIPENVTSIGASAIDGCENLTEVRICARSFLGESGLNCSGSQSVNMTLESSVESFPWNMVSYGSNVTLRIREGNLEQLPENRTDNYGYARIMIEQPLDEIKPYTLAYMRSAAEIELPETVQTLGAKAFLNSSGLQRIRIPDRVSLIKEETFKGCSGIREIQWPADLNTIRAEAFSGCSSIQHLPLPEGLTLLGRQAFKDCTSLTDIRMPDSLMTIETDSDRNQSPFAGCYNIKNIDLGGDVDYNGSFFQSMHLYTGHKLAVDRLTIRETVKSVNLMEFQLMTNGTTTFHNATLKALHLYKALPDFNTEMSRLDDMLEEIRMPASCNYSGSFVIEFSKLKKLIFDDSITTIYNYYGSWPELETIVLPASLRTVDKSFVDCPKLTDVNFNSVFGVSYTGSFMHCGFTELDLRTEAKFEACFGECDRLTEASVYKAAITGTFARNSRSLRSLYFGEGVTFESTEGIDSEFRDSLTDENTGSWPDLTIEVASDNLTELPCSCFHFPNLKTVHLPAGVTALGEGLFHGCERLETVTGLSQVKSIGYEAFINCKSLKNLDLTSHLKKIGEAAFENCASLRDLNQFVDLESVGRWAFAGCTSLRSVTGFRRMDDINTGVFMNCRSLESVDIGVDHIDVGSHAFMNCVSLKELPGNPEVGAQNEAFYGCTSLRRIRISGQGRYIGAKAFYHCSSLEEVTLPRLPGTQKLTLYGRNTYSEVSSGYRTDTAYDSLDSQCFNYTTGLKRLVIDALINAMPASLTTNSTVLSEIVLNNGIPENAAEVFFSGWTVKDDATGKPLARPLRIIVNAGETDVADEAFAGMDGFVGEILLDNSVQTIGSRAFAGNTTLSLVRMGGEVFLIADDAFEGCENAAVELTEENAYVQDWCALHQIPCTVNGTETVTLRLIGGHTYCESYPEGFVPDGEDLTGSFVWPLTEDPVLPDAAQEGHVFSGWYFYPQGPWPYHPAGLKPGSISLYPRWDIDAWQVTLECGSAAVYPGLKSFMAMPGDLLELSVPERTGELFTGWYTDAGRTEAFDGLMPAANLILYAGWQKDNGQMTFEPCGDHAELVSCLMDAETPANLVIPANWQGLPVTRIRDGAFAGQKVRTLTLPPMMDQISPDMLNGISSLEAIQINSSNDLFASEKGMILSKDGTELLLTPKNPGSALWIPTGVRRIRAGAGKDLCCSEVILNDGLEEIGSSAFAGGGIKVVRLPDSVVSVGSEAYYGCPLEIVYTGSGLAEIGTDAFEGGNAPSFEMFGNIGECAASAYADLHGYPYNYYTLTLMEPKDSNDTNVGSVRLIQAGKPFEPRMSLDMQRVATLKGWMEPDQLHRSQPDYMTDFVMPARDLILYPDYELRVTLRRESYISGGWSIVSWPSEDGDVDVVIPSMLFGEPVLSIRSGAFSFVPASVTIPTRMSVSRSAFPSGSKPVIYCHRDLAKDISYYGWDVHVIEGDEGLNFETNGGMELERILPEDGKVYASLIPQPVRLGYTFMGWFADFDLTRPAENLYRRDANGAYYLNVNVNGLTLYASWEQNEDFTDPDFTYIQTDGGLTVTGLRAGVSELTIPAELHGTPVIGVAPDAFRGKTDLSAVDLSALQMTELPDRFFEGCSGLSQAVLPEGMTRIGAEAFRGCVSLRNLALPSGLRLIGDRAFMGSGLTSLHLGTAVSQIGEDALLQTAFLEDITVENGNPYYRAENHALIDLIDARLVKYAGGSRADTFTVPEGVYAIGDYALSNASSLKRVILTDQVWELGKGAFSGCTQLESIPAIVSERLTAIPDYCFFNCTSLKHIVIPDQITRIGVASFGGHTAPETVFIPDTVESIGSMAFAAGNLTIHGMTGSVAAEWAAVRGIPFVDDSLPALTGFRLSADTDTLVPGQRIAVRPIAIPDGAVLPPLTWTVSDAAVLRVDEEGTAEALQMGDAIVTAETEEGLRADITFNVVLPQLQEIRLTPSDLNTSVGVQVQLDCRKIPQNAAGTILFASDNESVATVSPDGTLTGVSEGECTVTASCGSLLDTCRVTVFRHADSLDQPREKLTVIEGGRVSITIPEDLAGLKYRYSITDPSLVRVYEYTNQEGILWLHGISAGTAYLRLEVENGQTAEWEILVEYALQGVSFSYDWPDQENPISITPTFTRELKIKTQPAPDTLYRNDILPEISYRSGDESIATVQPMENPLEGCIVTAVSPGTVTIIAEGTHEWIHGLIAERQITVPEVDVTEMTLQPVPDLRIGEVCTTELSWEPAYATRIQMVWESGNEDIVRVDENGVLTAVGPGTTTLTVTSPSGIVRSTTVTVKEPSGAVRLSEHEITLVRGRQQEIQVSFEPEGADAGAEYFWSYDYTGPQAAYFSLSADGTAVISTGSYFGDVTIRVWTTDSLSDSCLVHVVPEKELLEILTDSQASGEFAALDSEIIIELAMHTADGSDLDRTVSFVPGDPEAFDLQYTSDRLNDDGETIRTYCIRLKKVGDFEYSFRTDSGYSVTGLVRVRKMDLPPAEAIRIKPIDPLRLGDTVPVEIQTTPEEANVEGLYFEASPSYTVEADTENRQIHAVDYGYAVLTVQSSTDPALKDSVTLLVAPSEDQIDPGVQLYFHGSTEDFEGLMNDRMTITVHAPGASRIELLNQDGRWEEMSTFDPAAGTGTLDGLSYLQGKPFLLLARADYDPNRPLEMRVSNPIRMNITGEGAAPEAELEIERETYSRGEMVCFTLHPVDGMNTYGITILNEQGETVDTFEVYAQNTDMTGWISTSWMPAGVYEIRTYTSGVGYSRIDSAPGKYFVTITEESGDRPIVFDVQKRHIQPGELVYFSAWAPGADSLRVVFNVLQNEVYTLTEGDGDTLQTVTKHWREGTYEYWCVASYSQDGEIIEKESEHIVVQVGDSAPTPLELTVSPRLVPAGSNVTIRAEGLEAADNWAVWVEDDETSDIVLSWISDENTYSPETGFVIDGGLLTEGHRYTINVYGIKDGCSRTDVSLGIVAYPSENRVVRLPVMLNEIEEEAFSGLRAEVVIIPAGVSRVGHRAFADCDWLKAVVFESADTFWEEDAFENCPDPLLLVP